MLQAEHAPLLELTARLFVQELDVPAIEGLRHVDIALVLEQLQPGLGAYLEEASKSAAVRDELAAEFCRLFLMSKATSPMLSVWLGSEQIETGARLSGLVDQWQAELEVELNEGPWGNLPKDHVAVSLGLLSLALVDENLDVAAQIQSVALQPAVPRFADAVLAQSQDPLYRAAVQLLRQLVG